MSVTIAIMRHDREETLAILDDFVELRAARVLSGVGALALTIPPSAAITTQLDTRMVVFYRNQSGNYLFGGYLLRRVVRRVEEGRELITLYGLCYNSLLERRIVAYAAGSPQAQKSGPADNIARAVVRENLLSSAGSGRDLSSLGFSAESDLSLLSSISVSFAYKKLVDVMAQVAQTAWGKNGERMWWDFQPRESGWKAEFVARKDFTGTDRRISSSNPIWLSPEMGAIRRAELDVDRSQEVTWVLAGGRGEGSARATATAQDTARISDSAMNRIEDFYDAAHIDSASELADAAARRLREGQAMTKLDIELSEAPGFLFGRDFVLGSAITARVLGMQVDVVVRSIELNVSSGGEEMRVEVEAL